MVKSTSCYFSSTRENNIRATILSVRSYFCILNAKTYYFCIFQQIFIYSVYCLFFCTLRQFTFAVCPFESTVDLHPSGYLWVIPLLSRHPALKSSVFHGPHVLRQGFVEPGSRSFPHLGETERNYAIAWHKKGTISP